MRIKCISRLSNEAFRDWVPNETRAQNIIVTTSRGLAIYEMLNLCIFLLSMQCFFFICPFEIIFKWFQWNIFVIAWHRKVNIIHKLYYIFLIVISRYLKVSQVLNWIIVFFQLRQQLIICCFINYHCTSCIIWNLIFVIKKNDRNRFLL